VGGLLTSITDRDAYTLCRFFSNQSLYFYMFSLIESHVFPNEHTVKHCKAHYPQARRPRVHFIINPI